MTFQVHDASRGKNGHSRSQSGTKFHKSMVVNEGKPLHPVVSTVLYFQDLVWQSCLQLQWGRCMVRVLLRVLLNTILRENIGFRAGELASVRSN